MLKILRFLVFFVVVSAGTSVAYAACDPGHYENSSYDCVPCEAGYYCQNDVRKVCPAGSYCPYESETPVACPEGFTMGGTGLSSKGQCLYKLAAGTFYDTFDEYSDEGFWYSVFDCVSSNVGSNQYCPSISLTFAEYSAMSVSERTYLFSDYASPHNCPANATRTNGTWETCTCKTGYTTTGTVGGNTVTTTAACSLVQVTCAAGQYLPAGATSCSTCQAGFYCPGGTYTYNASTIQGRESCPGELTSDAGTSSEDKCYITLPVGYRVDSDGWQSDCYGQTTKFCPGVNRLSWDEIKLGNLGIYNCPSNSSIGDLDGSGGESDEDFNACICNTGYGINNVAGAQTQSAACTALQITCSAGRYLPAGATSCSRCQAGSYCPGGTYTYSTSTIQGGKSCPYGSTSDAGTTSVRQCKYTVGAGSLVELTELTSDTPFIEWQCSGYTDTYCPGGTITIGELIDNGNTWGDFDCPANSVTSINGTTCTCKDGYGIDGVAGAQTQSAACTALQVTCAAGQYLPAGATSCSTCQAGSYCPGGTYTYNASTIQGRESCPYGSTSSGGAKAVTGCTVSAAGGTYFTYNSSTNKLTETTCVGTTMYCPAGVYAIELDGNIGAFSCPASGLERLSGTQGTASAITDCAIDVYARHYVEYNSGVIDMPYTQWECFSGSYCPGGVVTLGEIIDNGNFWGSFDCPANSSSGMNATYCTCNAGYEINGVANAQTTTTACVASTYSCAAGEYLPAGSTTCQKCSGGIYCPSAGTYYYSASTNQGSVLCPAGFNSLDGATSSTQCYVDVDAGMFYYVQANSGLVTGYEVMEQACSSFAEDTPFYCPGGRYYFDVNNATEIMYYGRENCSDAYPHGTGGASNNPLVPANTAATCYATCYQPVGYTTTGADYSNGVNTCQSIPNEYTVTLNAAAVTETTPGTSSVVAIYDAEMPKIAALPVRKGWTFLGYFDQKASGTGVQYYDADGNSVREWDKASDATLYAQWQIKTWNCSAGTYLPAGSDTGCAVCLKGYYCGGGLFAYTIGLDKGLNECPAETNSTSVGTWVAAADHPYPDTLDGASGAVTGASTITQCIAYGMSYDAPHGTATRRCGWNPSTSTYSRGCHWYEYSSCDAGYYADTLINQEDCIVTGNAYYSGAGATTRTSCPDGYTDATSSTLSSKSDCQMLVAPGYMVEEKSAEQVSCNTLGAQSDVYCPGGYVNYADLGVISACPENSMALSGTYQYCTCNTGYSVGGIAGATTITTTQKCSPIGVTVTLDGNGATTSGTASVSATYGSAMPTISKLPIRTGYTFVGYFDAETGGVQYYSSTGASTRAWDKIAATTLYAQWSANVFSIVYDANGGSGNAPTSPTSCTYGTTCVAPANTFALTGHSFAGWSYESDAGDTGTLSVGQDMSTIVVTPNTTVMLSPVWQVDSYVCSAGTYLPAGKTTCAICTGGSYCPGSGDTGYVFNQSGATGINACPYGYSHSEAGSDEDTDCYTMLSNGYYVAEPYKLPVLCSAGYFCEGGYDGTTISYGSTGGRSSCPSGFTNSIEGAESALQCWTTVTLDGNGGNGAEQDVITCGYAQTCNLPDASALTETGYTFHGGWGVTGGTGNCTDKSTTLELDIGSPVSYYACKSANTYTVTLDGNGATTAGTSSVVATYDAEMPKIVALPVRTGWTFVGYFDAETGGVQYYSSTGVSTRTWDKITNATLYARWTQDAYECAAKMYLPAGKTVCAACLAGAYCPGGNYSYSATSDSGIYGCPKNSYCPADSASAIACSSIAGGIYPNSVANSDEMTDCYTDDIIGGYIATAGADSIAQCEPGYYKGAHTLYYGQKSTCSKCDGITYSDAYGASTCESCPSSASTDASATGVLGYWIDGDVHSTVNGCYAQFKKENDTGTIQTNCYINADGKYLRNCNGFTGSVCNGGYYYDGTSSFEGLDAVWGGVCKPVGERAYFAGGTVSWNVAQVPGVCPDNQVTIGYGVGANENEDCGRKLHAGENVIYLRSGKRTNPSLNVQIGDEIFYGNLSDTITNALKVNNGTKTYSVVNDFE